VSTRSRAAVLAVAVVAGCTLAAGQAAPPTLAIVNARIFTGVAAAPWAEALTLAGDRIGVVGTSADVRRAAGASTRIIDAGGRVVIPGINDAHVHVGALPPGTELDGPPASEQDPSLDQILERLKAAVAKAPPDRWIYGEIGALVLDDPKATRVTLDTVAPAHPVMLTAWTGHGTLFNGAALRRLQIRDDEPDPPGGFFVREPGTRRITGLAHEYAEYIARQRLSMLADAQAQARALRDVAATAARFGITSVQMMATNRPAAAIARDVAALALPIRVRVIDFPLAPMASWREPASASAEGGARVTVSGTKWILDGTPVERLMLLREPYADRPAARGRRNFAPTDLAGFLTRARERREQPLFHAVGDGAIDDVLAALESTGGAAWLPLRPRIEHGDMLDPPQFERAKRLGVTIVQNPAHFMLPAVMGQRLGPRAARVTLMKSLLAAGVPVALGSDGPLNPYLNVMFASINANNPAEAMTREQAIAAYTAGSARAELMDAQKGTLAPGMLADLAILSQDIFAVAPDALPATTSILTLVGGTVVHDASEPLRPRIHFTPARHFMNDPNGLVFYKGEYHLFYQHNPFGDRWGHMSWGHAVSPDMLRWQHLPVALAEEDGVMIFSGSAVVDRRNTSGLCTPTAGDPSCLVAIYTGHTSTRQTQNLAYSNDRGRTWTKYAKNPVLDLGLKDFRDPKVFWHEATRRWIMVTVLPDQHKVRFFGSPDLKAWTALSDFGPAGATGGVWECPDLFELPIEGAPGETRWVLDVDINPGGIAGGSAGQYFVGTFDGARFVADEPPTRTRWADYGKDFYASLSFSDMPARDSRRIWMGWISNWQYANDEPTDGWRGAQSIPRVLTLRRSPDGLRIAQSPIGELETLRVQRNPVAIVGDTALPPSAEIVVQVHRGDWNEAGIRLSNAAGEEVVVGVAREPLEVFVDRRRSRSTPFHAAYPGRHAGPVAWQDTAITLRILFDRSVVEVFANDGATVVTDRIFPTQPLDRMALFPKGPAGQVVGHSWALDSVWTTR
jgi:sucrose-6-phosphate hydrolase SacC (GH32 family)/predicted amidohydrolase YtcJ